MTNEYLSIKKLSIKYDVHPDTIKKKDLIEGVHYIKIGKLVRYHVKNIHSLLCNQTNTNKISLDRFLIS